MKRPCRHNRRGSVVLVALWAVALGAILVGSILISAHRQSALGRQSIDRVKARWAARAGVEQMIALLSYDTESPYPDDAMRIYLDMEEYSDGEIIGASYAIRHHFEDEVRYGPFDEHSKINIHTADRNVMINLLDYDEALVDAITDWIDEDDIVTGSGAEDAAYVSRIPPYVPRNAPMQNIVELELVNGAWPDLVRREDWNLNNQLDFNEQDGITLMPDDDANLFLELGWAASFTAQSVAGGWAMTGQPRLYLPTSTADEIEDRTNVSRQQAEALLAYASNPNNTLGGLWVTGLNQLDANGNVTNDPGQQAFRGVLPLNTDQYRAIFDETTLDDPLVRLPGRPNVNTMHEDLLREILDPEVAEEIIFLRRNSSQGFPNIVDFLSSFNFLAPQLSEMTNTLTTRSNVFTITCTGRAETSGLEVQLIVVVDRSTLPVHILEYREE